jgi:hypothetical protein
MNTTAVRKVIRDNFGATDTTAYYTGIIKEKMRTVKMRIQSENPNIAAIAFDIAAMEDAVDSLQAIVEDRKKLLEVQKQV